MLKILIRFPLYFAFSYLILSIPVQEGSLYDEITYQLYPYKEQLLFKTKNMFSEGKKVSKEAAEKLFDIDIPKQSFEDHVENRLSAPKRKKSTLPVVDFERYEEMDSKALEKVIESGE